jgi:hypothetical protein
MLFVPAHRLARRLVTVATPSAGLIKGYLLISSAFCMRHGLYFYKSNAPPMNRLALSACVAQSSSKTANPTRMPAAKTDPSACGDSIGTISVGCGWAHKDREGCVGSQRQELISQMAPDSQPLFYRTEYYNHWLSRIQISSPQKRELQQPIRCAYSVASDRFILRDKVSYPSAKGYRTLQVVALWG